MRLFKLVAPALTAVALLSASCSHDIQSPAPALSAVTPDLVCNGAAVSQPDGVTTVSLVGDHFTPMPSDTLEDPRHLLLPRVTLTPQAALPGGSLADGPFDIADDPADPADSRVRWASESSMSFDVNPDDMLPTGTFDITITNPDGTSAATLGQVLAILPPPIVATVEPPAICDDQDDQTLVITGANFLVFDDASPTVTLGDGAGAHTYESTYDPADCEAVPGDFTERDVQLCTAITIVVPQGDFDVTVATTLPLVVTNPPPADCSSSSTPIDITIEPPPRVDAVVPSSVCDGGSTITIDGANFLDGATVTLDCDGVVVDAAAVTVNDDGTQISATFGPGAVANTACDVIVTNPDGCEDRPLPHKTVTVTEGPVVFFVDPDVVYNGINTRATIYATTIAQPISSVTVTIVPTGQPTPVTDLDFNAVVNHPNRLQAIVPEGQPVGVYDLMVSDSTGCTAILPQALTVVDDTSRTVTLDHVSPPFGVTTEDTAIEIFRDTAAAAPGDHLFVETPRVFLNPTNPLATDVAVPVESVAFLDGDRVTGIVPAGTPAHAYDVVLVNPDGTVGVLAYSLGDGYTETTDAPPDIESATPASIIDQAGQQVTLAGSDFVTGDVVTLSCVDASGAPITDPTVTSGTPSCPGGDCSQTITITTAVPQGSVCVVRLTNPDGTFDDYSAIGVTNSGLNLNDPRPGPDLNIGRRALSAATGEATSVDRYVYAIGGDDGTPAGAFDSIEFASVDPFGTIDAFAVQPTTLGTPRTLAGAATVGRYIYLVGGNDGNGPVATAQRAMVLSPRETPVIVDLDVALEDVGLAPGKYHYRISAVFTDADPDNPGGESLASDEFTVRVPSFPGQLVALTLVWRAPVDKLGDPLPNIAGYRVYRTVAADDAPGTEVLLGTAAITTDGLTFTDDGTLASGTDVPLPRGSTGRWLSLPGLSVAREGPAVTWAKGAGFGQNGGDFYVYAALGRQDGTTANDTYEFATITLAPNDRQSVPSTWTVGTLKSGFARWQAGAFTVDGTIDAAYAGGTYVFFGGGLPASGTDVNARRVEAGHVGATGQLENLTDPCPCPPGVDNRTTLLDNLPLDFGVPVAGYGVAAANGQLFTFGGVGAVPSPLAKSAVLGGTPPALDPGAWNDEGLTMSHSRYLLGSAVQSSFIFLLGGQTEEPSPAGDASKTTELVIW